MENKDQTTTILQDTDTTTMKMLTPEMIEQLEQLECWRRDQTWKEAVIHGLTASNGADQARLYFEQVMYTVKQEAPESFTSFMDVYIRQLKYGIHVEDSLEYAVLYQRVDLLVEILARYAEDEVWQEWVRTYRFLLQGIKRELTYEEILEQTKDLVSQVSEQTLKLRLELLEIFARVNLGNYDKESILIENFSDQLELIEESFMKCALKSRLTLLGAHFLLCVEGNVNKAEKRFSTVIMNNATPSVSIVLAYRGCGFSVLDEPQKCLSYLETAIARAEQFGLVNDYAKLTNEYYPFVRNIHGEHFDVTDVVPEEQAHQYIVRGDLKKALYLIEELEVNGEGGVFLSFYKAKALKDKKLMSQVRDRFESENFAYMLPIVDRDMKSL